MIRRTPTEIVEATKLTIGGDLTGATTIIQRLLQSRKHKADTTRSYSAFSKEGNATSSVASHKTGGTSRSIPDFDAKPRTGLRQTLRNLAGLRMPIDFEISRGGTLRPPSEPLPAGASFTRSSFINHAGTRDYKLYVPRNRSAAPSPLVIMLHGCTQDPDDFAAGTRTNAFAERHGCLVAYPAQASSANTQKCWNWFKPTDQRRAEGEPALIAGIAQQIMREHSVDQSRVYIAGLSAGGAAAAIMGAVYPDLFAAVGVHSGLALGAAHDVPSAFAAMRGGPTRVGKNTRVIPTIVLHGDQDTTVHPKNGDAIVAQSIGSATGLRLTIQRDRAAGGHSYTRTVHADPMGRILCEQWVIHDAGHAWAGGSRSGSYTDPQGPDATREMLRFFFEHRLEEMQRQ